MKGGVLVLVLVVLPLVMAQQVPTIECEDPALSRSGSSVASCVVSHPSLAMVSVCVQEECKKVLAQEGTIVPVRIPRLAPGEHEYTIVAKGPSGSSSASVTAMYDATPYMMLKNVKAPSSIRYGEEFKLVVELKTQQIKARNVTIFLQGRKIHESPSLVHQELTVMVDSSLLYKPLLLKATFEDEAGTMYESSWELPVELTDVSVLDRVSLFFRRMFSVLG